MIQMIFFMNGDRVASFVFAKYKPDIKGKALLSKIGHSCLRFQGVHCLFDCSGRTIWHRQGPGFEGDLWIGAKREVLATTRIVMHTHWGCINVLIQEHTSCVPVALAKDMYGSTGHCDCDLLAHLWYNGFIHLLTVVMWLSQWTLSSAMEAHQHVTYEPYTI